MLWLDVVLTVKGELDWQMSRGSFEGAKAMANLREVMRLSIWYARSLEVLEPAERGRWGKDSLVDGGDGHVGTDGADGTDGPFISLVKGPQLIAVNLFVPQHESRLFPWTSVSRTGVGLAMDVVGGAFPSIPLNGSMRFVSWQVPVIRGFQRRLRIVEVV